MTFRILLVQVREAVEQSLKKMGIEVKDFDVSEPPRKEFGDLTCNVAFQLSKQLKKRPSEIAGEIIEKQLRSYIESRKGKSLILSAELHPAGYINFRIDNSRLALLTLDEVVKNSANYGYFDLGKGNKHIVIEHTSVNPNKALHVGHMRNVILGDTIYRIMKATNHKTTVLNYVDDSGLQVADIIIGFKFAGFPLEPPDKNKKFDHYSGDEVYVKINEMYEKDPSLAEKRKLVLKEIEQGNSEIARFASEITLRVLKDQLETCWRMKARYDLLNFESHIVTSKLWAKSFEVLKKSGIVVLETEGKNKGAYVIKGIEDEEDKIIVRSDGTATYIAKDIPYAAWKLGLLDDPFYYKEFAKQWDDSVLWATEVDKDAQSKKHHPQFNSGDKVVTIIDSRQSRLQKIISHVLSKLHGVGNSQHDYYHLGYEAITLSSETARILGIDIGDKDFMHMSGRKGIYVSADYVLETLHSKSYEEVKKRNPEMPDEQANEIAEEIAISAIRYNMIKQDLDKIITFDIKESLSLEGDTGPYLQYAYARSRRILDKFAVATSTKIDEHDFRANFELLRLEPETDVVKQIAKFDIVVEEAAKTFNPKAVARYAYSLATIFNLFYEKVPVIKEQDLQVRQARLGLVIAFSITLKNALNLLGIDALERM